MTRTIRLPALALLFGLCLCPASVRGETLIASHADDNDPVTEGWTLDLAGPGTLANPGNDQGTLVWMIDDATTGTNSALFYRAEPTPSELTTALSSGWRVSAALRAYNPPGEGFTQFLGFATGSRVFQMHFRAETNADLTVLLFESFPPFAGPTFTVTGGANAYHTYELASDGASGTASLLIDGNVVFSGYGGSAFSSPAGARFGCGTSNAIGTILVHDVQFWIGPAIGLNASIGQPLIGIATSGGATTLARGVWHLNPPAVVSVPLLDRPNTLALAQNAPNPFSGSTRIQFNLPERDHVTLRIFDVTGRAVRTVADRVLEAGSHDFTVSMNGQAPGLYFYRLMSRHVSLTRKMLLLDSRRP